VEAPNRYELARDNSLPPADYFAFLVNMFLLTSAVVAVSGSITIESFQVVFSCEPVCIINLVAYIQRLCTQHRSSSFGGISGPWDYYIPVRTRDDGVQLMSNLRTCKIFYLAVGTGQT
jgi:hypothetical protein